ncbi:hypothetical protein NXY07_26435 [Phocaeicola dorei]|nr:hypothetical protein [Phocaeicola dorei]
MIPLERRISDDTRLIDLTVGELKELFVSLMPKNATPTLLIPVRIWYMA